MRIIKVKKGATVAICSSIEEARALARATDVCAAPGAFVGYYRGQPAVMTYRAADILGLR